jgi:small RNA 2'-O-methyltransferase
MPTTLHAERLDAVLQTLLGSGAASVLDLGCGTGELLKRLLREPQIVRMVGVDRSREALRSAKRQLASDSGNVDRVSLLCASCTDLDGALAGFDAAALVETIEHIDPDRLSALESAVFRRCRPGTVVITTPNCEYNPVLGIRDRPRHRDHRFEWPRAKFSSWARGVADRNRYRVAFSGVGGAHPVFGAPTQMATFTRFDRVTPLATARKVP